MSGFQTTGQFDNRTIFKNAEIRTSGFRTLTVVQISDTHCIHKAAKLYLFSNNLLLHTLDIQVCKNKIRALTVVQNFIFTFYLFRFSNVMLTTQELWMHSEKLSSKNSN